ncbi:putative protein phosphatase 2C 55-like [Hibiscus syriacus]|uniref:Nucleotide-diphospho-sugar transferase domain-containing protein n=1 Tax=Hibiscus syriacus TaxID=106335 RepID=A0A6A2X6J1_HIBSY|nr:putative protein phosphatase 2C 55-like [Hibiscus syriacus]
MAVVGRRDKAQQSLRSRIAIAIVTGLVIGCLIAFYFPHGLIISYPSVRTRRFGIPISSPNSSLYRRIIPKLKKQIRDLKYKLRLVEQGKDHAEKQFLVLGEQHKGGPFGTVKALRTNPTVIPDTLVNPRLAKILEEVAVEKELVVALANSNVKETLEVWFSSIKRVGTNNYLVIALDDHIVEFCKSNDVPVYKRDPDDGIDAVVYLQNPFNHLYRDSNVESMTDGHDNMTAYGYNDVFDEPAMGWARFAHTMRIWVFNSGFFYTRPTIASIELLDRVADRLARQENSWDQAVFNEELFFPPLPGYDGLLAAKRTMDFYMFMNSKVLFKTVRKDDKLKKLKPAIVHVNYHPDKLQRMKAVLEFYINGKRDALDAFPDGSE